MFVEKITKTSFSAAILNLAAILDLAAFLDPF